MWDSVVLVDDGNGSFRVKVSYLYNNNPPVIFVPENSKFQKALTMSQRVIHQLKKKGQLDLFQDEINKKIQMGRFKLNDNELKKVMSSTHNFCYLSMVMSET